MSEQLPQSVEKLAEKLREIPGIGKRSSQKLALDLLGLKEAEFEELAQRAKLMRETVRFCKISGILSETEISPILSDSKRDQNIICIVEKPTDIFTMEKTDQFKGTYHVLFELISPLDNIFLEDTNLPNLFKRLEALQGSVELVIFLKEGFATEATIAYLKEYLESNNLTDKVTVTRLAQGLPLQFNTDYLDQATMLRALLDRRKIL